MPLRGQNCCPTIRPCWLYFLLGCIEHVKNLIGCFPCKTRASNYLSTGSRKLEPIEPIRALYTSDCETWVWWYGLADNVADKSSGRQRGRQAGRKDREGGHNTPDQPADKTRDKKRARPARRTHHSRQRRNTKKAWRTLRANYLTRKTSPRRRTQHPSQGGHTKTALRTPTVNCLGIISILFIRSK